MYYLKQTIISFGYLVFMSVTTIGILLIGDAHLAWLKGLLCGICVAIYMFLVGFTSFKDGQEAYKILESNDVERKRIIETGEDLPLNRKAEYRPWKGFLTGFITCVPLFVCMIIHSILVFAVNPAYIGAGDTAKIIYMLFFSFTRLTTRVVASPVEYYYCFISVPVILAVTGIPYILGAKRAAKQRATIENLNADIYGDNK